MSQELRHLLEQDNAGLAEMNTDDPDYAILKAHRDAVEAFIPLAEHDPDGNRFGLLILVCILLIAGVGLGVTALMTFIAGLI